MFKKTITLILALAGISLNHACMNPVNTFIVVFYLDTMVSVDLSVFERIGQIGANYYKQTADYTPDYYAYTSHYNKKVLITIGPYHIQFTVDTSKISLDSLKADTCVYKELQWLEDTRIVSMEKAKGELIAHAFSKKFKSMVYWTAWDTLLKSDNMLQEDQSTSSVPVFVAVDCGSDAPALNFPPEMLSYGINRIRAKRIHNINIGVTSDDQYRHLQFLLNGRKTVTSSTFNKSPINAANFILESNVQKTDAGQVIYLP